jgi:hypothetical protein
VPVHVVGELADAKRLRIEQCPRRQPLRGTGPRGVLAKRAQGCVTRRHVVFGKMNSTVKALSVLVAPFSSTV